MNKIIIRTAAQNQERLHNFYDDIGWEYLNEEGTLRYDGQVIIELNSENDARTAIAFYTERVEDTIKKLIDQGRNIIQKDQEALCCDPNGILWIIKSIDDYPEINFNRDFEKSLLGKYFGLGIESIQFKETIAFYEVLGFKISAGEPVMKSYLTISQEGCQDITIFYPGNCPHSFFNPSLTFFNGKKGNPPLIEEMNKRNIQFTEEVTVFSEDGSVDNVIVEDGGGLHFFVFND